VVSTPSCHHSREPHVTKMKKKKTATAAAAAASETATTAAANGDEGAAAAAGGSVGAGGGGGSSSSRGAAAVAGEQVSRNRARHSAKGGCVLWCVQARRCIAPDSGRFLGGWLLGVVSTPSCHHSREPHVTKMQKKRRKGGRPDASHGQGGTAGGVGGGGAAQVEAPRQQQQQQQQQQPQTPQGVGRAEQPGQGAALAPAAGQPVQGAAPRRRRRRTKTKKKGRRRRSGAHEQQQQQQQQRGEAGGPRRGDQRAAPATSANAEGTWSEVGGRYSSDADTPVKKKTPPSSVVGRRMRGSTSFSKECMTA
jgi:hypothetical protein